MRAIRLGTSFAALLLGLTVAAGGHAAAAADPQVFVTKAAQAGMMEVELAKMAQTASTDRSVKSFAARMITDHGKANTDLSAIAKAKSLVVPAKLDAEHMQMVQSLRGKTGAQFDAAYAEHMAADHAKAVALFEANTTLTDMDLAAFATKTLPVLREHKQLADQLKASQK